MSTVEERIMELRKKIEAESKAPSEMHIRIYFIEALLGTESNNPELHSEFIASKAPDAMKREEEIAAVGAAEVEEKGMTVFGRDSDGNPILWDYQIKGFFKDACSMLKKIPGTESGKLKAFKKQIDGLIFVKERKIPIHMSGDMNDCQRPLRAQTAQGERVALAHSEEVPADSYIDITIQCFDKANIKLVEEWLNYGVYRGIGQWRNSGKGRFVWEYIED